MVTHPFRRTPPTHTSSELAGAYYVCRTVLERLARADVARQRNGGTNQGPGANVFTVVVGRSLELADRI